MSLFLIAADGWDLTQESDRRYQRILRYFGIPLMLLLIVIPFIKLASMQEGGGDTQETRYITLQPAAPLAPVAEEPKPEKEDEPKPEEKKEQPKADVPKATPTPEQLQQQARDVAQRSGVLAISDQLASLRDNSTLSGFDANRPLASDMVMGQPGTGGSGSGAVAFAEAASRGSGGITTSEGSSAKRRPQSGTGLDSRRTTVVESSIGVGPDKTKPGQSGDAPEGGRSPKEIQLVFDRNSGAFYAIFNRAMNEDPNLTAGKIVVALTIEPNGSVSDCKLVSSTFNNPDLERKLIARVRLLNFGAKPVKTYFYPDYPIVLRQMGNLN